MRRQIKGTDKTYLQKKIVKKLPLIREKSCNFHPSSLEVMVGTNNGTNGGTNVGTNYSNLLMKHCVMTQLLARHFVK